MLEEIFNWADVITYPLKDKVELYRRVTELRLLGLKQLVQEGSTELFGKKVLGKGTVGIVVKGVFVGGIRVSVKIRRMDASRPSLLGEARILAEINLSGIGPQLIAASRNFLVWEYVDGIPIDKWILECSPSDLFNTLKLVLIQLWILDKIGVAHNELSRFSNHILVQKDGKPVIIDFESASYHKFRANIPQFLSFLLNENSKTARIIREKLAISPPREKVRDLLRYYKKGSVTLEDILDLLQ